MTSLVILTHCVMLLLISEFIIILKFLDRNYKNKRNEDNRKRKLTSGDVISHTPMDHMSMLPFYIGLINH